MTAHTHTDVYIEPPLFTQAYRVYMRQHLGEQGYIAQPVVMKAATPEDEGRAHEPFMALTREAAQTFADALWHAGIRPTESKSSAGQFDAQSRHLNDMRAIVFKKLGVDKP